MLSRLVSTVTLAVALAVPALASLPAAAQSSEELVRSLMVDPGGIFKMLPGTSRRAVMPPRAVVPDVPAFTPSELRALTTRPLLVEDRSRIAAAIAANDLPSVDMEVYFAYDSAAILPDAYGSLAALGQALSDPRLSGRTFLIAGHTDASGSDAYNQALSERRARSVKHFLVANFDLDPHSLIAVGYGEEQLKDWYAPTAAVNRRVQIANLATR